MSVDIPAVTITGHQDRPDSAELTFPAAPTHQHPDHRRSGRRALAPTELPSPGFFTGGGGGLPPISRGVSGLLNQASSPMVNASGLGNAGSLASGVLNSGVDIRACSTVLPAPAR